MRSMWLVVTSFGVVSHVAGATGNNSTIAEAFPQLNNLQRYPASRYSLSVGAQDLDHCCLLAVNDSLSVVNGTLIGFTPTQSFIADDFQSFRNRQFPCAARYIGDDEGAPTVTIPYSYCRTNCPGWQRSKTSKLNQWVSPFVGFIIPAVVFCLAMPRRRKIWIPEFLIDVKLNELTTSPLTPFIAIGASIIVSIDTIVWLLTIFALSGPILVSGVYEAFLDNILLEYVQNNIDTGGLDTAKRARVLYTILVGNLDMNAVPNGEDPSNSAWNHINADDADPDHPENHSLLRELRAPNHGAPNHGAPNHGAPNHGAPDHGAPNHGAPNQGAPNHGAPDHGAPDHVASHADRTKTRLRAMLASQYSFGVIVGAPVVFFCASFIYNLIDNYSNLGDNDTSHALAFGMWWMAIPHIAIVSGLLLAGNNPNTLEGVVGKETPNPSGRKWAILELVYESRYRPAWIWHRGRNKRIWAIRLQKTYHTSRFDNLEDKITIRPQVWVSIFVIAFGLIVIPSTLAFLTSFYTPREGISCRSMTFLAYMLCQFCLILFWIWNILSTDLVPDGQQYRQVTKTNTSWRACVWYFFVTVIILCAVFTAIGGTMMQIIGVYRNCLCDIPITVWHKRYDANQLLVISTNSKDDIHRAKTFWKGTGITAVVFLTSVSFIGWWYQKRLRYQFKKLIERIDEPTREEMQLLNEHLNGVEGREGE